MGWREIYDPGTGGPSGGLTPSTVLSGTINLTAGTTFNVVLVDTTSAAATVNLPLISAVSPGRFFVVKCLNGTCGINNITVTRAGSDLIDGAATFVLNVDFSAAYIVSNGTGWSVI